jgi:hypothetical protein
LKKKLKLLENYKMGWGLGGCEGNEAALYQKFDFINTEMMENKVTSKA